jgi:hypothetical protein
MSSSGFSLSIEVPNEQVQHVVLVFLVGVADTDHFATELNPTFYSDEDRDVDPFLTFHLSFYCICFFYIQSIALSLYAQLSQRNYSLKGWSHQIGCA